MIKEKTNKPTRNRVLSNGEIKKKYIYKSRLKASLCPNCMGSKYINDGLCWKPCKCSKLTSSGEIIESCLTSFMYDDNDE